MTSLPRRVPKPWGHEEIWAESTHYLGKILTIDTGHRLSLQHHTDKDETVRVLSGEMDLTLEDASGVLVTRRMTAGDVAHIAPGRKHRMTAVTQVQVLEVSSPHLHDVVRHEDDYGRV